MVLLMVLGLLPFLLGRLMDGYLTAYVDKMLPLPAISLLFLVLWCAVAFLAFRLLGSAKRVVISLNAAAAVVLVLLCVQALMGRYWPNMIGVWTQFFYFPLLSLAFTLTPWGRTMFFPYCAAFLLMVAASLAGCVIQDRRKRNTQYR